MDIPTVVNASAIDEHTLLVMFTDGKTKKYDVTPLLDNDIFEPLRNPDLFRNFQIESSGYAISWNSEIDISEYELWRNGVEEPLLSEVHD